MTRPQATLVYDVPATIPYGGSCGIVARSLRHALRQHKHSVRELLVPVTDKTSTIVLPERAAPTDAGVHVFFEELFPRCRRDDELARHPNLVFFNLPHFRFPDHCAADGLIFNSKYLMDCFHHEAFVAGMTPPRTTYAALGLPLHDYPDGYPSVGGRIERGALKALRAQVHIGHALRPGKLEPIAALSILHHLNELARARGGLPFLLLVAQQDFARCEAALRDLPLPAEALDALLGVGHLDNRGVISVMRSATFGLCYDLFVEAFGFYPIESVYSGCPVFTNGCGNVRHLLPAGAGIEVQDQPAMYFGPLEDRVRAYRGVAERIFHVVTTGAGEAMCRRGARYIDRHYNQAVFAHRIGQFLRPRRRPAARDERRARLSPYLRSADWARGRFVTDREYLEVPAATAAIWRRLLTSAAPPRRVPDGVAIPTTVGAVRPA
jgi:hypothetical protein